MCTDWNGNVIWCDVAQQLEPRTGLRVYISIDAHWSIELIIITLEINFEMLPWENYQIMSYNYKLLRQRNNCITMEENC